MADDFSYYISGASGWEKTPYNAIAGSEIVVAADGQVKHSFISGYHGPGGNSSAICADCRVTRDCNVGGLIMKIGENGRPFCVDPVISGSAPESGPIYFGINDMPLNDNDGGFNILISGPGAKIGGSTFD